MVEPQKTNSQGRKLEDDTPRGVVVIFLSPVDLVIEEHANQGGKVAHNSGSDVDQAALAQPRPWRMANPKEDGL